MFDTNIPQQNYQPPWLSSFEDRKVKLLSGSPSVAYFYEKPDPSTFRYRVYNMIQALRNSNSKIGASFFWNADIEHLREIVDIADILVFCRTRYTSKIDQAITLAKNKGKKVFFDVDDLIFDTKYILLTLKTLDRNINHSDLLDIWFARVSRIGATLKLCDAAITTNEYLAKKITDYASIPVHVIPNFLNAEQLNISDQLFQNKKNSGFAQNANIHLGYFSGSATHNKDFDILSNALCDLFKKHPKLKLIIVGAMNIKGPLLEYKYRIQKTPLQDFINLQRHIAQVEINLVPLQDNDFTNCKSELKYFEAAITGTLTIASPTFTYANAIKDGKNGYLSNSYEWFKKIDSVIQNIRNYSELAEYSHDQAEAKYSWQYQKELIEQILLS